MTSGQEQAALRQYGVVGDDHVPEVVDPGVLADPDVVSEKQSPWVFDIHRGLDEHSFANFGPKQPQQADLQSAEGIEGIHKKKDICEIPDCPDQAVASRMIFRVAVGR